MGPGLPWCRQKSPPQNCWFYMCSRKTQPDLIHTQNLWFPATNELLLSYWKVQCLIYIMSRKLEGSKSKQEQWRDWVHDEQKPTTYGKIDPHLKDVSSNYISLFHSRIKATKIVKTCSLVFVLCVSEYIEQFVFAWLAARCPAKESLIIKFMINLQNS